jgi:hypothetical protein
MGAEEWTETRYKYFVGEQSYHIEFFNLDCNFFARQFVQFEIWAVGRWDPSPRAMAKD